MSRVDKLGWRGRDVAGKVEGLKRLTSVGEKGGSPCGQAGGTVLWRKEREGCEVGTAGFMKWAVGRAVDRASRPIRSARAGGDCLQ